MTLLGGITGMGGSDFVVARCECFNWVEYLLRGYKDGDLGTGSGGSFNLEGIIKLSSLGCRRK